MGVKLGIEVLLSSRGLLEDLQKKRVALVCHPASVDHGLQHSFDLLKERVPLTCAFGPQHGIKGEKQDNMIESDDDLDSGTGIPVYSLYGKVRRPTSEMMEKFDVVLFDLQDLGCRVYTFITTLLYLMEECSRYGKKMIILDRPNPAGRKVEGFRLESGWESFVGAAPIPMQYGLTVGELALYYKDYFKLEVDLQVIKMVRYNPAKTSSYGWPEDLVWINPSPNAANLNMARAYAGTVLLEGTHLSEGRGTTRPLEVIGAPNIDFIEVLKEMRRQVPHLLRGCILRKIFFQPTFHKYRDQICQGIHIHTEGSWYQDSIFRPFRLVAHLLKFIHVLYPQYEIFRNFPYEYEATRLSFDVINGGTSLRRWILDEKATISDLEKLLIKDEKSWTKEYKKYWLY